MAILYLTALIAVAAALLGFAVDTMLGMRLQKTWRAADDARATLIDDPVGRREGPFAMARPQGRATASSPRDERLESELEAA